jgi:hypothetical protein
LAAGDLKAISGCYAVPALVLSDAGSVPIATVEARHASYLRLLNEEVAFPDAFDEPKAPRRVCEMVDPFITKSPFNLKAFYEVRSGF